jgi:hypothetical protein
VWIDNQLDAGRGHQGFVMGHHRVSNADGGMPT